MLDRLGIPLCRSTVGAFVTWAVVSGLATMITADAVSSFSDRLPLALVLMFTFLAGMFACAAKDRLDDAARWLGSLAMLFSGLGLGLLLPIDFLPIYTIIWLAYIPSLTSLRWSTLCFFAVTLAWYLIELYAWDATSPLFSVALYATFHYFAMLSALEARRADAARARAESLNRELVATQHLLAEASRQGERTRIARDLHDLLGHHLTALTINLQVAERVTEGEARARVKTCHQLARDMLGDVRAAVTTLRDDSAVNFSESLRLIVANIPDLRIELEMDEDLRIDDVHVAESLLRCVQEAITNTLRHARASECRVRVWRADGRLRASIEDNGRVAPEFKPGNGLRGMRERIERLNGKIDISRVRNALRIDIQIPLAA